jgi:hypothetical protein
MPQDYSFLWSVQYDSTPKNCKNSRHFFMQKLVTDNAVITQPLHISDNQQVYKSLPNKMLALIIHNHYKRVSELNDKSAGVSSVVIEITFLTQGRNPHITYNQVLFEASPSCDWILRSKTNIVVSQLEDILNKKNSPDKQNHPPVEVDIGINDEIINPISLVFIHESKLKLMRSLINI